MKDLAVIVPAAGSGVRFGAQIPKPFIKLSGKAILYYTLSSFVELKNVSQIIVATSKNWLDEVEKIFREINSSNVRLEVVEGGRERQFSIQNALVKVNDTIELIAVHDAVRPFVKAEFVYECCKTAREYGGAVLGIPANDTIKKVNDRQVISETPDRTLLWQAQTPQIFQKKLLFDAYNSAMKNGFIGTDDASLVERIGGTIKMVEGGRENLKITYPLDLKIAELILTGGGL